MWDKQINNRSWFYPSTQINFKRIYIIHEIVCKEPFIKSLRVIACRIKIIRKNLEVPCFNKDKRGIC